MMSHTLTQYTPIIKREDEHLYFHIYIYISESIKDRNAKNRSSDVIKELNTSIVI